VAKKKTLVDQVADSEINGLIDFMSRAVQDDAEESAEHYEVLARKKSTVLNRYDSPIDSAFLEEDHVVELPAEQFRLRMREAVVEYAQRKMEGLKLFEPTIHQINYFSSRVHRRLVVGSNRSGKTLIAACDAARAMTGTDPFKKFPEKHGRAIICAHELKHVGQVVWRKMGFAGAFKMIRDPETGMFRAFRPWAEWDRQHAQLVRPAPPLVPPRLIKDIAWENKKFRIPAGVFMTNGWEALFFSAEQKAPNGYDVDLGWFDEEIDNPSWYPELMSRLVDRRGLFTWSATPQDATPELTDLYEQAENQAAAEAESHARGLDIPRRTVIKFDLVLADNPHIDEEAKSDLEEALSKDEADVRVRGIPAFNQLRVYHEFREDFHEVPFFHVPGDWTRYAAIDPGVQICAVLMCAVPPDEKYIYFFDELYISRCDAKIFAREFKNKIAGHSFEDFVIDMRYAAQTSAATGKTTAEHYSEELKALNIRCRIRNSGFTRSNYDVDSGITAVKRGLTIRDDGTPQFKFLSGVLPNLKREFSRFNMRRDPITKNLVRPQTTKFHLLDCLRYLALRDPKYVVPPPPVGQNSPAHDHYLRKQQAKKQKSGNSIILG